jgi:hypothetical protein
MASIHVNTLLHQGCGFALGLVCAAALPVWSGEILVAGAANRPLWSPGSSVAEGATAGHPPVPTWSAVPLGPLANPGWDLLPIGPRRAPGWSPPAPPVINKAPLWQRL